jgi:peptidoglycan biosynthesis protein MviN/MurJ (putative lipid II flippase)
VTGSAPADLAERPPEHRVVGSALVTASAQVLTMAIGGLLSLVIVLKFGKTPRTDGLFAAYGVYGVLALVAQSLRVTVVPRLLAGPSLSANLDRVLGAGLALFLVSGVPLLALGGPLANLLTGDLGTQARDTAHTALAILWIAAGAQLVAALSAAALGASDEFSLPAFAYVAGGALTIVSLFALAPALDIDAVAVGLVAGSALTAMCTLGAMLLRGYRPRLSRVASARGLISTVGVILGGATGFLLYYLTLVVSIIFAARMEEGAVTLYSYAFFTALIVMGATSAPVGVVMAAPLSRTWDRRAASLEPHVLAVFRTAIVMILPVFAVAALVGDQLVELLLGSSLTGVDADALVATFLALAGMVIASVAMSVPLLAAFSTSRYTHVAAISVVAMGIQTAGSAIAFETSHLYALGIATSATVVLSLVLLLAVVYGREATAAGLMLLRELARAAFPVALAFAPGAVMAVVFGGDAWELIGAATGIALTVLLVHSLLPEHWRLLMRIVGALTSRRPATAG